MVKRNCKNVRYDIEAFRSYTAFTAVQYYAHNKPSVKSKTKAEEVEMIILLLGGGGRQSPFSFSLCCLT